MRISSEKNNREIEKLDEKRYYLKNDKEYQKMFQDVIVCNFLHTFQDNFYIYLPR